MTVPNSFDLVQGQYFVGPNLVPKCGKSIDGSFDLDQGQYFVGPNLVPKCGKSIDGSSRH